MISLPTIAELRRITKALATLDLIICPDWESRYYSFDTKWSNSEEMASMRNGCGDDWFIIFSSSGFAGIKGLAHEYPAAMDAELVERIRALLPHEFAEFAIEPAFHWDSTSFCYWRLAADSAWSEVPEQANADNGAKEFLSILSDPCDGYLQFASDYYELELDRSLIEHVLAHRPLTPGILEALNPEIGFEDILDDLEETGYPHEN